MTAEGWLFGQAAKDFFRGTPSPPYLGKVLEVKTLSLDLLAQSPYQRMKAPECPGLSLFLFNCSEWEEINRQLAGYVDVFLNVALSGGFRDWWGLTDELAGYSCRNTCIGSIRNALRAGANAAREAMAANSPIAPA